MDIGSIFLVLGLLILVGLYISRPFFENGAMPVDESEHKHSTLLAERDRVINALQELDFDFTLGKIPEGDYPSQRAALLSHGADVLRKLDAYQTDLIGSDIESHLEAASAVRREGTGVKRFAPNGVAKRTVAGEVDDQLETLIANRRRERSGKASGFCPKCGRPAQKSDQFCSRCGITLS